jgi:predicted metal-dependent phosphoesterase TrpH
MDGCVDLHIHSDHSSDGDFSPAQLIAFAREAGFAAISIADHDTASAYPGAIEAAQGSGVEVVPSMEVTTLFEGREFHLLAPFLDWMSPVVTRIADSVTRGRFAEARERVRLLGELGYDITWEDVEAGARGMAPLGVTIAAIFLAKPSSKADRRLRKYYDASGFVKAPSLFYRDFFMEGKPAAAPKRHIDILEVLTLVPAAGAVPVLAHPGAYFQNTTRDDLSRLKDHGLAGVEVFTPYHTEDHTSYYAAAARELGLVATAGSDFHGAVKPHVAFGSVRDGTPEMLEALRGRRPS